MITPLEKHALDEIFVKILFHMHCDSEITLNHNGTNAFEAYNCIKEVYKVLDLYEPTVCFD